MAPPRTLMFRIMPALSARVMKDTRVRQSQEAAERSAAKVNDEDPGPWETNERVRNPI
jgi:hypothetical protein